jgi:hypothetical protein
MRAAGGAQAFETKKISINQGKERLFGYANENDYTAQS